MLLYAPEAAEPRWWAATANPVTTKEYESAAVALRPRGRHYNGNIVSANSPNPNYFVTPETVSAAFGASGVFYIVAVD